MNDSSSILTLTALLAIILTLFFALVIFFVQRKGHRKSRRKQAKNRVTGGGIGLYQHSELSVANKLTPDDAPATLLTETALSSESETTEFNPTNSELTILQSPSITAPLVGNLFKKHTPTDDDQGGRKKVDESDPFVWE